MSKLCALFPWFLILLAGCAPGLPVQPPAFSVKDAHRHSAKRVIFSPDATKLASIGVFGRVKVWSVPDLQLLHTDRAHEWRARGLVWTGDGLLVSGDDNGLVVVRDSSFQRRYSWLTGSKILSMDWLPGSELVITGGENGRLYGFAAEGGKLVRSASFDEPVSALAVNPAGTRLAIVLGGERVLLLDAQFQKIRALEMPERTVFDLAFSADGKSLVGSAWFRLLTWNLQQGGLEVRDTDHYGKIGAVAIPPAGNYVASISRITDSSIYLYDLKDGHLIATLKRHTLCGSDIAISSDGRYLASAGDDASIRIYDLDNPR